MLKLNPNKILSDIVAFRTYAKYLQHLNRRETIEETINRTMTMHLDKFPKLSRDIIWAFKYVHDKKVMPSMRTLQFSGEAIVKNNSRLYNCSALAIDDERAFGEVLFLLLNGTGVGYSVQKHHISKLNNIKKPREEGIFIAHDSIQGWAQCLDSLMDSYFFDRIRPIFDLSKIRQKGAYLSTTGTKAPGPEPLRILLMKVESILKLAIGRKLTTLEVHDIICIVADGVLAGGIRRSACISLFDKDDIDMITCKSGDWWVKNPERARSNNSVILMRNTTTKEEFKNIYNLCKESGAGEPGFMWSNDSNYLVNPCCLSGDSKLETENGAVRIEDIAKNECMMIKNKKGDLVKGMAWKTGVKELFEIKTNLGDKFHATKDHVFVTTEGEVEVRNLVGKSLLSSLSDKQVIVRKIISIGKQEVYDFNLQDNTHIGLLVSNENDYSVQVHNCEISLESNQFCNLSSINQTGIKTEKEFLKRVKAATILGTLQASYTDFPFLRDIWRETTERGALIGVSFTGIADNPKVITKELLRKGAELVKETNIKFAKKIGINPAERLSAVKPEGTSSTIISSSSGIHARHSDYYIRRIRMIKDSPLGKYLKKLMPELVEDDLFSETGIVVSIPQKSPEGAITRENESAKDLFKRVMVYNKNWVKPGHVKGSNNNNVSCTISLKEEEWEEIGELMWKERNNYTGISLLPYDGGNYQQAPFEEINKEKFEELLQLLGDVDLTKVIEMTDLTERNKTIACSGGVCDIDI